MDHPFSRRRSARAVTPPATGMQGLEAHQRLGARRRHRPRTWRTPRAIMSRGRGLRERVRDRACRLPRDRGQGWPPTLDQTRSNVDRTRPRLADLGQKFGPTSVNFGLKSCRLGPIRAAFDEHLDDFDELRPISSYFGPISAKFGRFRPIPAEFDQISAELVHSCWNSTNS